jgi:5-methylthioadenosine/S-adenosylhomocysteine deaminase
MQTVELLVAPRWLVPVNPAGQVYEEHALIVDGGRIADLLPRPFAEQLYAPREVLELPRHALLPGLVNAHTHAAMTLLRGLADDLPLMEWLQNHIWPAEARHVSFPFCADGVRLAAAEMIRGGTTCFNDMYFFPEATASVAREVGLRVAVGLIVLDFPSPWAANWEDYLHRGLDLHDRLKGTPLIRTVFAPHAPYSVNDAALERLRVLADELGLGVHMHVHETAAEIATAIETRGQRPWRRLAALGLLGENFLAVHMTQLEDEEIAEAARLGVCVAHCPESNLKLASGYCPVARLRKAGVNVALGTDGAASNNDLDLWGEMRTAALLAKGVAGAAEALPAAEALHLATLGGARALGWDEEIGSLAKGKSADFIAVDLAAPATQPVHHLLSQLVYAVTRDQVTHVYVAGRALMRERRLLTLDETETLARAEHWRTRLVAGEP